MKILIVDDHEVAREGLRAALSADQRYEIVGSAGDARGALELARMTPPSVAVIDVNLPDRPGPELCRDLCRRIPGLQVVVLSSYLNEEIVRRCLDAGAAAYITKAAGLAELRKTLDDLDSGAGSHPWSSASQIVGHLSQMAASRAEGSSLTPNQIRVLELVADGLTYREIAERLFISASTVRFHVQNLKVRFGVRSLTELVVSGVHAGLIARPQDEAMTPQAIR